MKRKYIGSANLKIYQSAKKKTDDILLGLDSGILGLSREEAIERIDEYGYNKVDYDKLPAWYIQFAKAFHNPFIYVLLILALVSAFTDDPKGAIIISAIVIISSFLMFFQEYRSTKAVEKLQNMVSTKATVLRDGKNEELEISELVPGDIIYLAAGDMVPADIRILHSRDLFISQAMLSGESLPVEKFDHNEENLKTDNILEISNICLMGTNVVSGTAMAVIVATGSSTYFGSLARSIMGKRPANSFEKGINSVSWMLIRFMMVMVPVVFLINGFTKDSWMDAFFFAISVAVGLTPEMLPVIVTANLSKGSLAMARRKVVVKRLNSIQNLGAMDILCTDKTGTLTQDKIILEKHMNIHGEYDENVLKLAYLNSFYQTGLKNLLDSAILNDSDVDNFSNITEIFSKVDELPFDFVRRRMSVVVSGGEGDHMLICKGAVEEMHRISSYVSYDGQIIPFSNEIQQDALGKVRELNKDGFRVLAIAYKEIQAIDGRPYSTKDEDDMILIGYLAFLDPPKETASPALAALLAHGVKVKILTGDNEIVTAKICREVELAVDGTLLGKDIDKLSDEELQAIAENTTIFAKMSPLQKARVIRALQDNGHVVGFLGDGINDAPALKDADVGISVDTATDIAKESADIILLEKSLMVLEEGVIEGRKIFGNIMKYIKMTTSSNFGNVFSVLGASILLPFLPMKPIHLLIQSLLYHVSQLAIPFDKVDQSYIEKPRKWDAPDIARFTLFIGPISSIFDYLTFFILWNIFKANAPENQAMFQTGWFMVGLATQTMVIHMIRTRDIPFLQSTASPIVILASLLVVGAGCYIPFSPLAPIIGMQAMPAIYFAYMIFIVIAYCITAQMLKILYIRKFRKWL